MLIGYFKKFFVNYLLLALCAPCGLRHCNNRPNAFLTRCHIRQPNVAFVFMSLCVIVSFIILVAFWCMSALVVLVWFLQYYATWLAVKNAWNYHFCDECDNKTLTIFYFDPWMGAKHCDECAVCGSVCPLRNHTSRLHKTFCTSYLWPWLSPPLITIQYVRYFMFYGWRHEFI